MGDLLQNLSIVPIGLSLIGLVSSLFGAFACLILGIPLKGPLLYDEIQGAYSLSFRMLARLAIPSAALGALGLVFYLGGSIINAAARAV